MELCDAMAYVTGAIVLACGGAAAIAAALYFAVDWIARWCRIQRGLVGYVMYRKQFHAWLKSDDARKVVNGLALNYLSERNP